VWEKYTAVPRAPKYVWDFSNTVRVPMKIEWGWEDFQGLAEDGNKICGNRWTGVVCPRATRLKTATIFTDYSPQSYRPTFSISYTQQRA